MRGRRVRVLEGRVPHRVSPYLTSYVLHVCSAASRLGHAVAPRRRWPTPTTYLEKEPWAPTPPSERGLVAAYTALAGLRGEGPGRRRAQRRTATDHAPATAPSDRMPVFALAYLLDALAASGDTGGPRAPRTCSGASATRSCPRAASAHVEELVRSVPAVVLELERPLDRARAGQRWSARAPDDPLVARMVRWLLRRARRAAGATRRRTASPWRRSSTTTRSARRRCPTSGPWSGWAREHAGHGARSRAGPPTAQAVDLPMPELPRARRGQRARPVARAGRGRGHALLHRAPDVRGGRARCATASIRDSAIERAYAPATATGGRARRRRPRRSRPATSCRVTLDPALPKERRYVAVTDPLPAGFEPVESWFATTASDLARAQDGARRRRGDDWALVANAAASTTSSATTTACCSSPRGSPRASTRFTYVARATTSGTFRTAPAHARRCTSRRSSAAPAHARGHGRSRDTRPRRRTVAMAHVSRPAIASAWPCVAWIRLRPAARRACSTWTSTPRPRSSTATASPLLRVALRSQGERSRRARRGPASRTPSSAPRSPPRTRASSAIPASTRSRSSARPLARRARRRMVEGGSTITQQAVKLLHPPRSLRRAASCGRRCSPCASSTGSPSARSSPCT